MNTVFVLGRDAIGTVAEDRDPGSKNGPFRYYLTDCCGASAKGMEDYVGCRKCYQEIDPQLGDVPDKVMIFNTHAVGADRIKFIPRPDWTLIEVYGDGLPYEEWRRMYGLSSAR